MAAVQQWSITALTVNLAHRRLIIGALLLGVRLVVLFFFHITLFSTAVDFVWRYIGHWVDLSCVGCLTERRTIQFSHNALLY